MATRGVSPNASAVRAVFIAIWASCLALGCSLTVQSAKKMRRSLKSIV